MNLLYLTFNHVAGFNDLTDQQKDEFISLYQKYIGDASLSLRERFAEKKMTSVYVTRQQNYRVSFESQSNILFKPEKKEHYPTALIRLDADVYQKIKELSDQKYRTMMDIISIACRFYKESGPAEKLKPDPEKRKHHPTVRVRIYTDVHQKIKQLSDEENCSMVDMISKVCDFYLAHYYQQGS